MENQINTGWFHTQYAEKYGYLHGNKAISALMYFKVMRLFFMFMRDKLNNGFVFRCPIGEFKVVKVNLDTEVKRISFAGTVKENGKKPDGMDYNDWLKHINSQERIVYRSANKSYFHTLKFYAYAGLQDRYTFKMSQDFLRKIHHHYD